MQWMAYRSTGPINSLWYSRLTVGGGFKQGRKKGGRPLWAPEFFCQQVALSHTKRVSLVHYVHLWYPMHCLLPFIKISEFAGHCEQLLVNSPCSMPCAVRHKMSSSECAVVKSNFCAVKMLTCCQQQHDFFSSKCGPKHSPRGKRAGLHIPRICLNPLFCIHLWFWVHSISQTKTGFGFIEFRIPFAIKPKPVCIKPCEPVSRRFTEWNQDGRVQ